MIGKSQINVGIIITELCGHVGQTDSSFLLPGIMISSSVAIRQVLLSIPAHELIEMEKLKYSM